MFKNIFEGNVGLIKYNHIYEISGNNFIVHFQQIIHPVFEFAKINYDSYFAPVNERLLREGKIVTHHDPEQIIKSYFIRYAGFQYVSFYKGVPDFSQPVFPVYPVP